MLIISIGNHAMLLVQLGINNTRDVWKFATANGATANVMDKEAYRKISPGQQKLKKAKSIMQPYHTDKNRNPPLCIVGNSTQ